MLPLSTAVSAGDFVFLSGVPPTDSSESGIDAQTRSAIRSMADILQRFGLELKDLVYVQLYLKDMRDFETVNRIYEEMMPGPYPARKVIQTEFISRTGVEINGIATGLAKRYLNEKGVSA